MSDAAIAPARASIAVWAGFAMMCVGMFMAVLDIQVVATSLPTIRSALSIPLDQMSWVQTAYLIAEVIAIPLTGFLTRALTIRWLFVISISVFTFASIGCATSATFEHLIAWRVLQGFAGGTLIPAVFAAVFVLFPPNREGVATTLAGVLAVLAPTTGPLVGGWITETFSWHWLFLINVAPGLVSAVVAGLLLPRSPLALREAKALDLAALALLALSLAALEIGLKQAPEQGWASPAVLLLFALCAAAAYGFAMRVLRRAAPLVELRVFADPRFAIACLLSFVLGIGLFGSVYMTPVFLALVRGHGALAIGEIMLVTGAAQLVAAPIAVLLERRIDARVLSAAGFLLFAIGLAMSANATPETDFEAMFWPQVVRGAAIMFCLLPPTRLALGHLPVTQIPNASGLFNLMRNLGGAIGIALVDTIIFTRTPEHAGAIAAQLAQGDMQTARTAGIPMELLAKAASDVGARAALTQLTETLALTRAFNDAWLIVAILTASAILSIIMIARSRKALRADGGETKAIV